jgi:hypothetical protein
MKTYEDVDVWIHILLTSALVGGQWPASRPCRFIPGERTPGIHWIGYLADPKTGLDDKEKSKFFIIPRLEFQSVGRPARSQLLSTKHLKQY